MNARPPKRDKKVTETALKGSVAKTAVKLAVVCPSSETTSGSDAAVKTTPGWGLSVGIGVGIVLGPGVGSGEGLFEGRGLGKVDGKLDG